MKKHSSFTAALTVFYYFLLLIVYPLWVPFGYPNLANDKYDFYMIVSLAFQPALLILTSFHHVKVQKRHFNKTIISIHENQNSAVSWRKKGANFIFPAYIAALTLSMLASPFRQEVLLGCPGWWMGYLTYITYALLFLITKRLAYGHIAPLSGHLLFRCLNLFQWIGSFAVNILAILNRLSLYPIPGTDMEASFLSTIGNVDWFGGYMLLFLSWNAGLYLISPDQKPFFPGKLRHYEGPLQILYLFTAFLAVYMPGISGAFIPVFVTFCIGALYTWSRQETAAADPTRSHFLLELFLFGAATEIFWVGHATGLFFHNINSYDGTPVLRMARAQIGLILMAVSVLLWKKKVHEPGRRKMHFPHGLLLSVLTWSLCSLSLILLIIQIFAPDSFSPEFGNSRGFIWQTCSSLYHRFNGIHQLFGAGPDGLAYALYSQPDLASLLKQEFGSDVLTNAHSDLLNTLLNSGLVGLLTWIAFIAAALHRLLAAFHSPDSHSTVALPCLLCLISCILYHMISFKQIMDTPYLIIILALSFTCTKFSSLSEKIT